MQTTLTSRAFNQQIGEAKKSAKKGPVFVTDRGEPTHVLLSFAAYRKMKGRSRTVGEALAYPPAAKISFEPERLELQMRPVELD